MKKIKIIIGIVAALVMIAYPKYSICAGPSYSIIIIKDVIRPSLPPVGRTCFPIVEASIEMDSNTIQVDINWDLGAVTIIITDQMGRIVSKYNCDSNIESTIFLSTPSDKGEYVIRIFGKNYEGEGYFQI